MTTCDFVPDILSPWALLTADGGLLAFLIGLYTLVGRERKSPYLINSVFVVFLVGVLSAAFSVASVVVPGIDSLLLYIAAVLLLTALLLTFWRVYRFYFRLAHFVDDVSWWPFKGWRQAKERQYEHDPDTIGQDLTDAIKRILGKSSTQNGRWDERTSLGRASLSLALEHHGQATDILVHLAVEFLQAGHAVQYLTASRHPIEFVRHLKESVSPESKSVWHECAKRVVVVDAFTPHFGFTDSIHGVKTQEVEAMEVACIPSSASYAGMHTAASNAFKLLKERATSPVRGPTLVIYEDTRAVVDLESAEQYRIFVRHVIPSERMWDGMFTVFTEVAPPKDDWKVLSGYTGFTLDMREPAGGGRLGDGGNE